MFPVSLRESLRATGKELVWQTVRYQHGEKRDICLFCTRRGGSTWLMEVIAANRRVLPLNQPLEILTPNLTPYQFRRLPKFERGQIVHPDPDQEQMLREYTDDLMAGRIRVNAPHAFWRRGFEFRADRLLLKIVDAKPMIDWFDRNYDVSIAYLVRHPIPQAMSCIRNGWATTTFAYTRNEWFEAEVLRDSALRNYAEDIDRTGTAIERFVLNWVVENLYPLRVLADRPHWLALSYEECVVDRDKVLATVSEQLQLDDTKGMARVARRASRSSTLSTDDAVAAIESGDTEAQIASWQSRVDADDLTRAQRILERFGVSLYETSTAMPNWAGYR